MYLLLLTTLSLALSAPAARATDEPRADDLGARPNVILIVVDDLGWGDLACQGNRFIETPRIDQLARSGLRFTHAYGASAVCSPSRAALLTGRAPARIGLTDYLRPDPENARRGDGMLTPVSVNQLPLAEYTLAERLLKVGYATAHIGKWHLSEDSPKRHGFTLNLGGTLHGRLPTYFDPYSYPGTKTGIETLPSRKPGEYITDREADEAVTFLRDHASTPFFLHLSHHAVHKPIEAKQEFIDYYQKKSRSVSQAIEAGLARQQESKDGFARYAAMVSSVDQALGRIIDTLNELGLTERTLVIFTSDNGGLAGVTRTGPLRAGKGSPYENGLRVPFIASWPGRLRSDKVSAVPVSLLDVVPTVLACVAGAEADPANLDGVNLMPLLEHGNPPERERLFWHYPHYYREFGPHSVVRRRDFKLILWYERGASELYDLRSDPAETHDLAARRPKLVKQLEAELEAWIERVDGQLPRAR